MPNSAMRRAFSAIGETCPEVDRAAASAVEYLQSEVQSTIDDMIDRIKKEATMPLREALIEAYERVDYLEGEVDDLTRRNEELEQLLADARAEMPHA